jgi:hypothetical protein
MRLAALDSSRMPFGPVLLAEVDGELKAAIDVREDRVIADPFSATTDVVDLLRLHARAIAQREERRIERPSLGALRLAA